MSRLYISLIIFLVCVCVCFAGAFLVKDSSDKINLKADEVYALAKSGNGAAVEKANELLDMWESEQIKLIPFTPMKRIDDINLIMYALPQKVENGEGLAEISQIKFMMNDLYAAEGFNIYDLF